MALIATDSKTKEEINIDTSKSRAIAILGKRGSGKSYTLGRFIEQVHYAGRHTSVVIDPMGIFWSVCIPKGDAPAIPVNVLVPGSVEKTFGLMAASLAGYGCEVHSLRLNASDLTPEMWLRLLGVKMSDAQGIALTRALRQMGERKFNLLDLIEQVEQDDKSNKRTLEAVVNRLDGLAYLGVFGEKYKPLSELLKPDMVNVINISGLDAGPDSLRNLVVDLVVNSIFSHGLEAWHLGQFGLATPIKPTFLFIDEAHNFVPRVGDALGKPVLIRYIKEGRAPDLSIAVATQEPAAVDPSFATQSDVRIFHMLSSAEDIDVAAKMAGRHASAVAPLMKAINEPGRAIVIDDLHEKIRIANMLPRDSVHGTEKLPPPPKRVDEDGEELITKNRRKLSTLRNEIFAESESPVRQRGQRAAMLKVLSMFEMYQEEELHAAEGVDESY